MKMLCAGFVFSYCKEHCRFHREKGHIALQWNPHCYKNGGKLPFKITGNIHDK